MTSNTNHVDCKFTSRIETDHSRYVVELPDSEIEFGTLSEGDIVRVSLQHVESGTASAGNASAAAGEPKPPVSVGEQHTVEIEDMGDQGDGIARVDRGYVLIVPETEPGEVVTVEIQETKPNYGFATAVEEAQVAEHH